MTEKLTRAEWEARLVDEREKAQRRIREDNSRGRDRLRMALDALRSGRRERAIELLEQMHKDWSDGIEVMISEAPNEHDWQDGIVKTVRTDLLLGGCWFSHIDRLDMRWRPPLDGVMSALTSGMTGVLYEPIMRRIHKELCRLYPEGKLK